MFSKTQCSMNVFKINYFYNLPLPSFCQPFFPFTPFLQPLAFTLLVSIASAIPFLLSFQDLLTDITPTCLSVWVRSVIFSTRFSRFFCITYCIFLNHFLNLLSLWSSILFVRSNCIWTLAKQFVCVGASYGVTDRNCTCLLYTSRCV